MIKGYKVFNPDWTCKGFQFEVGKIYEENVIPTVCKRGFHFCEKAGNCFNYYDFNPNNKVAEVIALGDVDTNGEKSCTNRIHIVREIEWLEVLEIVNTGKWCTGLCNTGNRNTGNWNTGNCNTGDRNTGYRNTGDCNTGNCNTGDCNTGNYNTGNRNTGNCNTGDWNTGNYNTGCFMTAEQKISMFNKETDWTYSDWLYSDARRLLNDIPKNVVEWIYDSQMTEEEKVENFFYEIMGGYLKMLDESECAQIWWDGLTECERDVIKSLPNFDAEIFKQCTGITI